MWAQPCSHALPIPLCPQHLRMAETVLHVSPLIDPQTPHEVGVFAYLQMRELRRNSLRSRSLRSAVSRLLTFLPRAWVTAPMQPGPVSPLITRAQPHWTEASLLSVLRFAHSGVPVDWAFPFFSFPTNICGMVPETPAPSWAEACLCYQGNLWEANPCWVGQPYKMPLEWQV